MSLKSSIIALAGMVGKCQENSRSLKQCLELGLLEVSKDASEASAPVETNVLWTNETPSSAYAPAIVTLAGVGKTDYDAYLITFATGAPSKGCVEFVPASWIDDNALHIAEQWNIIKSTGVMSTYSRPIGYASSDDGVKVDFHACSQYEFATYPSAGTSSMKNGNMIPLNIIGLKF